MQCPWALGMVPSQLPFPFFRKGMHYGLSPECFLLLSTLVLWGLFGWMSFPQLLMLLVLREDCIRRMLLLPFPSLYHEGKFFDLLILSPVFLLSFWWGPYMHLSFAVCLFFSLIYVHIFFLWNVYFQLTTLFFVVFDLIISSIIMYFGPFIYFLKSINLCSNSFFVLSDFELI